MEEKRGLLDTLNNTIEKQISAKNEIKIKNSENPMDVYRDLMNQGGFLEITFDLADKDGNLTFTDDNGITFLLREEVLGSTTLYYNKFIKDKFIGIPISVKIGNIDDDKKLVEVLSSSNRMSVQNRVNGAIRKALQAGEKPIVLGRIVEFTGNYAIVDILGRGVRGKIYVKNWSERYTDNLRQVAEKNEYYDFEVMYELKGNKENRTTWALTRKGIAPDPWENIPQEYLEKDAVLLVTCTKKPTGKGYWWGTVDRIHGIEVQGRYNVDSISGESKIPIMVGQTYKCKIRNINTDPLAPSFLVSPFALADAARGSIKIIPRNKK